MGQYYKIAVNYLGNGKKTTFYSDRKVKGYDDYIMAKLREHSFFGNILMDSVANLLHDYEVRLAWIGDYAEVDEVKAITKNKASYLDCWGGIDDKDREVEAKDGFEFDKCLPFDYSKKFLVNLSKREYISFDEYMAKAKNRWQFNPISILTAIGNGRGGGDYLADDESLMEKVGSWAWDVLTIDDEKPKRMRKLDIDFGCEEF